MPDAPPIISRSGLSKTLLVAGVAAGLGCAVVLFQFDPAQHGFFPRCFFRLVTGWDCPGCGGLRATHQLLHGNVREAFALNPLLVVALPVIALFAARPLVERLTGRRWPGLFRSTYWLLGAAVVIFAFGLLRNLPWGNWLG